MIKNGMIEAPELITALSDYLDCPCEYFPPMEDDNLLLDAYRALKKRGLNEGFTPMVIVADETLWECLIMNSVEGSDLPGDYSFDAGQVAKYRAAMLSTPIENGKSILDEMRAEGREDLEGADMGWEDAILGEMSGGEENNRFLGYWNYQTRMTYPLILAELPTAKPWEVFAYLPFGGWNECPDTLTLMAIAKYWFEKHGAMAASITHDVLEFSLPSPVSREQALELAKEQYVFCPDIVDQGAEDATIGTLADGLLQSDMWYFWWD